MIEGPLALHDDYNEVVEEIIAHLLSFSPVPPASRFDSPPFLRTAGGNFPLHCVYETGDSEEPKGSDSSILPGVIDINMDFVYPSVGSLAKRDGVATATLETRKVYSDFRKALYTDTRANMDGRVRFISLVSSDSGDFDAFGNPRGAELRTESILFVRRVISRIYL